MKEIIFSLILNALTSQVVCANEDHEAKFQASSWQILKYSSLKENTISFDKDLLTIGVDSSASPLIYPLSAATSFKKLHFKGHIKGTLNLKEKQGDKGADDFLVRVGVVYEGEQTLNFFQKAIAAKWITTLFELAPSGSGVSYIQFFNLYDDDRLKDQRRTHPQSELLKESFVAKASDQFDITVDLDPTKKVLALWLSSDGDDTNSRFQVQFEQIKLLSK
ncbi:hypothetical protein HBN50_06630 [Halobacteriovorax sp. GB3]|uniref:hypothetical protein n=1 Tax=Halobacteriovorax sp. GB3 TaxID=2719615 RepID=UPI002360AB33|nr:hypothetical protein [Halobacteriovorax sp. GB3]MDD0852763.1 hypothetical protein [Halobacteriovorax sp. GB3]